MNTSPIKVFFAALLLWLALPASVPQAAASDEPVSFELELLDGSTLAIADLRGQWVVVNYWATWCAPCRKEIPDLSDLHERRNGEITVVGIAYEDTAKEDFINFLDELGPTYPNGLVDVYNPPQPFGAPRALPTTYLLNPDGISVKTFVGPVTGEQIEAFVAQAAPR
jgi:thiol-disulfide isomerase/thioredoxin